MGLEITLPSAPTSGGEAAAGDAPIVSFTIDLNIDTPQVIYTVPPGMSLIPVRDMVHSFSVAPSDTDLNSITVTAGVFTFTHSIFGLGSENGVDVRLAAAGNYSSKVPAGTNVTATVGPAAGQEGTAVVSLFGLLY
jgi:hypothetical protein